MQGKSFSWALVTIAIGLHRSVTRDVRDDRGNAHWRREIFQAANGIFERWPSGHICLFHPTQEDMLATDWKLVQ